MEGLPKENPFTARSKGSQETSITAQMTNAFFNDFSCAFHARQCFAWFDPVMVLGILGKFWTRREMSEGTVDDSCT
jgi:hypothetical protein